MADPGKYLIGESLREKLKSTIAKVDSIPFGGPVSRIPTSLEAEAPYSPKVFRVCTFTGSWAINAAKEVTFRGVTTTPNTVSVTNLLGQLPAKPGGALTVCNVAKDGTAWYLVSSDGGGIKRGNFEAPWNKGDAKSVLDSSGVGSYSATNYFANVAGSGTKKCAIAYTGGEWILIAAEC